MRGPLLERALVIGESRLGRDSQTVAMTLTLSALCLEKQMNYAGGAAAS